MNEPCYGYIGVKDLSKCFNDGEIRNGFAPTPYQGMVLGEGIPQQVNIWTNSFWSMIRGKPSDRELIDPQGVRAWRHGRQCVWADEGVWGLNDKGRAELFKPNHFAQADFGTEFYVPFAARYTKSIQSVLPKSMIFVEMPPMEFNASAFPDIDPKVVPHAVNAMHWYDAATLLLGSWSDSFTIDFHTKWPVFGAASRRQVHERQLKHINSFGKEKMHNAPTLIGEVGIPFNLNDGEAYKTGDFSAQVAAMDNTVSSLEANLLSFTLWCYAADNSNKYGDLWNLEDLSLASRDTEQKANEKAKIRHRDASARALVAFSRPHATRVAGIPTKSVFKRENARYELEYTSDKRHPISTAPTEIYVPRVHYPKGFKVMATGGKIQIHNQDGWDLVSFQHDPHATTHSLVVVPKEEVHHRHILPWL
jgi:hypothetical protein